MSHVSLSKERQHQILDSDGRVRDGVDVPDLSEEELVDMYRAMKLGRHFDERAVNLQRQGRLGTYPPLSGQEGAQVGSTMALDDEDWLIPSYREHVAEYVKGVDLSTVLQYWKGQEEGNNFAGLNVHSDTISVGGQIPHATGMAWAARLDGDDRAFLCHFGDGATSEGDFHEGLNFAGVFDVPAVFFCNNNQWAISVPNDRQTAADTFAQKATAYGFEGVRVDGMDPLAVYQVTRDAIRKAKNPDDDELRPTLVEAVQYRFGAHTTADDPSVYRDKEEVQQWKNNDPIPRLETFLRNRGVLDDERIDAITQSVEDEVAEAITSIESQDGPDPAAMFANVYAEMPARLEQQQQYLAQLRDEHGDDALLEH